MNRGLQILLAGGATMCLVACGPVPASPADVIEVGPNLFVAGLSRRADHLTFVAAAETICEGRAMCMVGFWTEDQTPSALPFSEEQIANQAFAYTINRRTGFVRAAWDCDRFPQPSRHDCLPRLGQG